MLSFRRGATLEGCGDTCSALILVRGYHRGGIQVRSSLKGVEASSDLILVKNSLREVFDAFQLSFWPGATSEGYYKSGAHSKKRTQVQLSL